MTTNIVMTQEMLQQFLAGLTINATQNEPTLDGNFVDCKSRFSGNAKEDVNAFIDALTIYKEYAKVSDPNALLGLAMLLDGDAATLWQVTQEEFLCEDTNTLKIEENPPCEVQSLKYGEKVNNYQHVPVELEEIKIQKIENNKWTIIASKSVTVKQECGKSKDNVPIKGSYIIEISDQCKLTVKNIVIKTYQNLKPDFKLIKLPKIEITEMINAKNKIAFEPLDLAAIDLDDTQNIYNALKIQKNKLLSIDNRDLKINHYEIVSLNKIDTIYGEKVEVRCDEFKTLLPQRFTDIISIEDINKINGAIRSGSVVFLVSRGPVAQTTNIEFIEKGEE
ncbi:hypothetical protein FQR65_LT16093 [Abscondita terminalis]|nr:hypothetical protein FQR65_LT16093 [Abscondita terminalis]